MISRLIINLIINIFATTHFPTACLPREDNYRSSKFENLALRWNLIKSTFCFELSEQCVECLREGIYSFHAWNIYFLNHLRSKNKDRNSFSFYNPRDQWWYSKIREFEVRNSMIRKIRPVSKAKNLKDLKILNLRILKESWGKNIRT